MNLSGDSVTDPEIAQFIEPEFSAAGRDPASIVFEVTETAAIANMDRARVHHPDQRSGMQDLPG